MRQWMVAAKKADFYAIAEKFHVDPVVARIIRNREVIGEKYPDLSGWEPFGPVRSASDERYGPAGGNSCTKDPETGAYPDYRRL